MLNEGGQENRMCQLVYNQVPKLGQRWSHRSLKDRTPRRGYTHQKIFGLFLEEVVGETKGGNRFWVSSQ